MSELATRLAGSSDLYQDDGRKPYASINFITCHDGFTLQDMVSYNEKHNEANGEDNRDGANDNNSWNCGAEGPTDDPKIIELRERQKRNLMANLMLSVGVPMMLGGDELSHGQNGNNNAYCQDNELTWLGWELDQRKRQFLDFTKQAHRDPHEPAGVSAPQVFHRTGDPRLERQGHFVLQPVGRRDVGRATGMPVSSNAWESAWPAT